MPTFISAGTEIAGYRVESLIGRGGMAVVYRAEHIRLGRKVALKLIAPDFAEDEKFRQRFIRESQLAASIDHPNILPVYEADEVDGLLYIAMRYVDGSDLKDMLAEQGRLDTGQVLSIFPQVARALDVAHGRGLIHRDVKPANILLTPGPDDDEPYHAYLSDFGLTKRASSHSGLTATGQFVGTLDYVAPEQITAKPVGSYTDIYALGCVVFECLTGTVPFDRETDAAMLYAHLNDPPPDVTSLNQVLPTEVDSVVATAMAKSPEDRFSSCRQFVQALQAALSSGSPPAISGPRPIPAAAPPPTASTLGGPPKPDVTPESPPEPAATPAGSPVPAATADAVGVPEAPASPPTKEIDPGTGAGPPPGPVRPAPSRPQPPRPGRPGPGRRLLVLLAVVALLVAGTAGVLLLRSRDRSATFAATAEVPYSFTYPGRWQEHVHAGLFTVLSPDNLVDFFTGVGEPWAVTRPLLEEDPGRVVGAYLPYASESLDVGSTQEVESTLLALLPQEVEFGSHQPTRVGGAAADRVAGRLVDPSHREVSLAFVAYAIQVKPGIAVQLVLFGPDEAALQAVDVDRLVDSVRLDPARVAAL